MNQSASSKGINVPLRGLYAIVDIEALATRGLDPLEFARAVLDAEPAAVQLRDKLGPAKRTLDLLSSLTELARPMGVPIFANDRPDLAILSACAGVHVGQDDVSVRMVRDVCRKASAELKVGLSTHNRVELGAALEEPIDYVAVGPVFATTSKEKVDPVVGIDELRGMRAMIRARRPGLPLVAIGGITRALLPSILPHVDAVAVIGALLPEGSSMNIFRRVTELANALQSDMLVTKDSPS